MLKFPSCPKCYAPDPYAKYLESGSVYSKNSGWSRQEERFKFTCSRCEYVWGLTLEWVRKNQEMFVSWGPQIEES